MRRVVDAFFAYLQENEMILKSIKCPSVSCLCCCSASHLYLDDVGGGNVQKIEQTDFVPSNQNINTKALRLRI